MKLNIQKFQGGGTGLGSLFSAVQVAAPSATPTNNTDDSDKASDAILSESTLNKLRSLEYGLPNELDRFEIELAALEQKLNSGRRVSPREIADIRAKAGRLIAQAGHLKNAEQNAEKNGFLDDVAIDYRGVGYIYAITEKGIDKVSFRQYNPEKHQALTYSELIEYRRQSPQLINDAEVIASINKGVGLEKINTFITDILKIVNDSSSKQEAYTSLQAMYGKDAVGQLSTQDYAAIKDIAQMVEHVGLDTIFKTTNISNNANLQHAFKYIASILPKNMQAQLEASYIVNGGSYKDAKTYIGDVISLATQIRAKDEYEIDYPKEFNTAMGTKAGAKAGGSSKSYYDSPLETFFNGNMNQGKITISDPDSKNQYGLEAQGNTWGQLVDLNGNVKSNLPLSVALNESIGQFLDFSQVYLGDKKVNSSELQNVAYENAQIAQVWLPVTGPDKDIDWRRVKAFAKAEKQIQELGYTNISDKNKVHAANDSYMRYNDQGELVPQSQQTERFLMTHGYTIDDLAESTSLAKELTGVDEDAASVLIDSIYAKDRVKKQYGISDMRARNGYDNIMKLPIFVRISPTASSDVKIAAKHGPLQTPHTEEEFMVQQKINESDYIQADSSMI